MAWRAQLLPFFSPPLAQAIQGLSRAQADALRELRVRVGQPLEWVGLTSPPACGWAADQQAVQRLAQAFLHHSAYARQEEVRRGFLTAPGGHRVGLCGRAVLTDGRMTGLRDVSSLCVRIARAVPGAADWLLPLLFAEGAPQSALLFSAPGLGKTTLLRDAVRQLSDVRGLRVGLVDERGEVAGSVDGVVQLPVGSRTDVLDGCPKAQGMPLLLRAMAPQWLAVDEVGGQGDADALADAARCGVSVLATAHGDTLAQLRRRPALRALWRQGMFARYVRLGPDAAPAGVWDAQGQGLEV
ncbi:MAG: stage III sporulation protein AA [Oscillospiraceae bacterium]|nr:stage III sporulation protein AA [Oscillospiraceae bacterium]